MVMRYFNLKKGLNKMQKTTDPVGQRETPCYTNFSIEHYEPNPHQVKEPMLKNRTYQRFSWREKYRLQNMTEQEARSEFAGFGNNWRLFAIGGNVIIQNHIFV